MKTTKGARRSRAPTIKSVAAPKPLDPGGFWACIRRWTRVVWVCRVSFVSVLVGALAFTAPQVRDLFLDASDDVVSHSSTFSWISPILDGLGFSLIVAIFWAAPAHSVARLAISDPAWLRSPYFGVPRQDHIEAAKALFDTPARWVPRALGLLCFVIPIVAAYLTWQYLPTVNTLPVALVAKAQIGAVTAWLFVVGGFFAVYVFYRRAAFNKVASPHRRVASAPSIGLDSQEERIGRLVDRLISLFLLACLLSMLACSYLLAHITRLWLIPVLLGVWIPLIGWLARYAHHARAPLIAIAALVVLILDYGIGDNHVVDFIENRQPGAERRTLDEAVKAWRLANKCAGTVQSPCPSPIVALVAGGGSRSAYFAGETLGLLLDATCAPLLNDAASVPASKMNCKEEPLFARRLFAISSVSGGSVGAAVFANALADSIHGESYSPPCAPRPTAVAALEGPMTWRACLRSILAEDLLSPLIAGLGFRDVFAFVGKIVPSLYPDRGHRFEQAMENAYATGLGRKGEDDRKGGVGLHAPFLRLAPPTSAAIANGAHWRPALIINSTSSETGRKFLFSGLSPLGENPQDPTRRWPTDAYDFHEVVGAAQNHADVTISAAMNNSARFPVLSPAGALSIPSEPGSAKTKVFTRLVDGGYFDNFGASSALDLVLALRSFGLTPFILVITNDPIPAPTAPDEARRDELSAATASPEAGESQFAPLLAAPFNALIATSTARGEVSLAELRRLANTPLEGAPGSRPNADPSCASITNGDPEPCFARIAVYEPSIADKDAGANIKARVQQISMSWWLSNPVRQYLDDQIRYLPYRNPGAKEEEALVGGGQRANARAFQKICLAMASTVDQGLDCMSGLNHFTDSLLESR